MTDSGPRQELRLEYKKIELERYKARLDLWKFLAGSVCAAIVIAAIPPAFQWTTAKLEEVRKTRELELEDKRKEKELNLSKATFHDSYVKDFLEKALNQDIEIRIRLGTYFADVSDETYKTGWQEYLTTLSKLRDKLRREIDDKEKDLYALKIRGSAEDVPTIAEIERDLKWKYGELGYSPPDRDVVKDPRSPDATSAAGDNFIGIERRAAKLAIGAGGVENFNDLQALIASLPSESVMESHVPPITTDAESSRVAEEQRNVHLRAFLYAASREVSNDFRLILGPAPDQPETYMIAVVSGLPRPDGPSFPALKAARDAFKAFFGDHTPEATFDFYDPPIPLEIDGSLFFNIIHKNGVFAPPTLRPHMKTIWEIRPVTKITFQPADTQRRAGTGP
jgi:hypothetical protein